MKESIFEGFEISRLSGLYGAGNFSDGREVWKSVRTDTVRLKAKAFKDSLFSARFLSPAGIGEIRSSAPGFVL